MATRNNEPEALKKFKYEVANEVGVSLKDGAYCLLERKGFYLIVA